ncbi:MAG: hypothetical protein G01um101425_304 [Candidatus Peregrinibacteria bacterium Gr01-1014_25]|nr:MAG: hypothetical protein G01um101425_304 [Candidatus Peregrinibacteria bacterium Gr01-1014_25]
MNAERSGDGVDAHALVQTLPRHLGWALRAVGGEEMTSDMQALLRQQMVQTFNAVIAKREEFSPKHGTYVHEVDPGERAAFAIKAAIEQTRLGLEYLVQQRGMDTAAKVVRRADIAALLRLGRGLCMDLQMRADALADRSVVFLPRGLQRKDREFYVRSSAAWQLLTPFHPRRNPERADAFQSQNIATMFDYHAAEGRLRDADGILALTDRIGVTRRACADLAEDEQWEDLLLRCVPHGATENTLPKVEDSLRYGFVEMAVFAQSFAHAHGTEAANCIELPRRLLPRFERLFDQYPEDIARLERACDAVFGADATAARACLAAYLGNLVEHVGITRDSAADVLERAGLFPNCAVHADYCARHQTDMRVATSIRTAERPEAMSAHLAPFLLRMPELQALSDAQLAEVVAAHPHAVEWNPILFDHPTVADLSGLIRRIFDVGTERARIWVADFLLLLYAFDSRVMAPGSLMSSGTESTPLYDRMVACMQGFVPKQTPALPERISRAMTDGIHAYARAYVESIVQNWGDREHGGHDIVLNAEEGALPEVYRLKWWHPAFMETRPELRDIFQETRSSDYGHTLAYSIRRGWLTGYESWSECIDGLSDRARADVLGQMEAAMPGDHMICELVGHLIEIDLSSQLLQEENDPESDGKRQTRILDLPVSLFIDAERRALRFMPGWGAIGKFMQALTAADRRRVFGWIQRQSGKSLTEVIQELQDSDVMLGTFKNRGTGFLMRDVPVLREICARPNHGLRHILLPVAKITSIAVRKILLEGALCSEDTLALAMYLLREGCKEIIVTAGQVARGLRDGEMHPILRGAKPLGDVLVRNAALRDALADALEKQGDTPIGKILVPVEEFTLLPVDADDAPPPEAPTPRRRRRATS